MSEYIVLIGSVKSRDYQKLRAQLSFSGHHVRIIRADVGRLMGIEVRTHDIEYDASDNSVGTPSNLPEVIKPTQPDVAYKQAVDKAFGIDTDAVLAIIFEQNMYDTYTDPRRTNSLYLITNPAVDMFPELHAIYATCGDGSLMKV